MTPADDKAAGCLSLDAKQSAMLAFIEQVNAPPRQYAVTIGELRAQVTMTLLQLYAMGFVTDPSNGNRIRVISEDERRQMDAMEFECNSEQRPFSPAPAGQEKRTMELTFSQKSRVSIVADAIRCVLNIDHGDEDMPNNYPHRKHETWDVTINIHTGQIQDWPSGVPARDLYMKVVDCGSYYLMGNGKVLAEIENDYVPDCIPGDYGDYVDFKIDGSGRITNWKVSADDVTESFFTD